MVRQLHLGLYTKLCPRGGGHYGPASFLENSIRKQRQERGSRGRKLHPLSGHITVTVATPWGTEHTRGTSSRYVAKSSCADSALGDCVSYQ